MMTQQVQQQEITFQSPLKFRPFWIAQICGYQATGKTREEAEKQLASLVWNALQAIPAYVERGQKS